MDVSCESMSCLLPFKMLRWHDVFVSVWAPHRQSMMHRSLFSTVMVRGGVLSAAGGLVVLVVVRGDDLVYVINFVVAIGVGFDCGRT